MLAINVIKLGKIYDNGIWGLRNSTFTVEEGELAVLIGPNGAGKTTCVKMLTTILRPTEGKAEVLGFDVFKDYGKIREKIAYLPQGFSVSNDLTPMEAIKWNLVARGYSLVTRRMKPRGGLNSWVYGIVGTGLGGLEWGREAKGCRSLGPCT